MNSMYYSICHRQTRLMLSAATVLALLSPVLASPVFAGPAGVPGGMRGIPSMAGGGREFPPPSDGRGFGRPTTAETSGEFERFVQQFPNPRARREISDQEHAKYQRESGQNRSFEELFGRASAVGRGEYLGVEPDISRNIYRFKFMRAGGNVVWVDMDGRTGKVLSARQ